MDAVNLWKRTLLQWIKGCNFADKAFYNIEQTEVEVFFEEFKNHIKGNDFSNLDLPAFLNEHYPDFQPNFDDEKALSSNDYLYVYSLLLHFSCVKCGDEFFQKQCQKLSDTAQQNITTFLKKLLETNSFTKDTIRHAIASISVFPPSGIFLPCRESPIKTPLKSDISPPTPRSNLLQEKNTELQSLKVQLENEVYEKSLLESEIKQNQEKILKLSQELKKSNQAVKDLKNDLYARTSCNDSEEQHFEDKEINRKLRKEISQKETEIEQQRENIDILMEEKNKLSEKLKCAEKQMKIFQNRFEELTIKIDELRNELKEKDRVIEHLLETKTELEQHIFEIRSSSASSRPDLNISVECLDVSRTTNSSDSIHSPENLGFSVVEFQLREKENENTKLRDEIELMRVDNTKLSKHMRDLTMRYSVLFDICSENLIIDQDSGPIENFIVFSNYVEKIAQKYEKLSFVTQELKENNQAIQENNQLLCNRLTKLEREIEDFNEKNTNLQNENQSLKSCKEDLEVKVIIMKEDLEKNLNARSEDIKKLESLQNELLVKCETQQRFEKQIIDMEKSIKESRGEYVNLQEDLNVKLSLLKTAEIKIAHYEKEKEELLLKIERLDKMFESDLLKLKDQYNSQISFLESQKNELQLAKDMENKSYENSIIVLKENYNNSESKLKEILDCTDVQLSERDAIIFRMEKEKDDLAGELHRFKTNLNALELERNVFMQQAEIAKTEINSLETDLHKNKDLCLKLTDDCNKQNLIINGLQIDKQILVNQVLESIAAFKSLLNQFETKQEIELDMRNKEQLDIKSKLNDMESNTVSLQKELDNVSMKYLTIKDNYTKQTEFISSLVDELKARVAAEFNIDDEMISQNCEVTNKLKSCLNLIMQKLEELSAENVDKKKEIKHLSESVQLLTHTTKTLEQNVIISETNLKELREDFESELQCEKNKSANELKRLGDDLKNLGDVCDHLTEENSTLQSKLSDLKIAGEHLAEENKLLKAKNAVLESERQSQLTIEDQLLNTQTELKTQVSNMQSCVQKLEVDIESAQKLLSVKTQDVEMLLEKQKTAEYTIDSLKKLVTELQSKTFVLENDLLDKQKIKEELKNSSEHTNKLKEHKKSLENKCQVLDKQIEQLKNDLTSMSSEVLKLQYERNGLLGEIEYLKKTTYSTENHMEKCNKEIDEQKSNISRLIKEIASIRREKELVEKDKNLALKQIEEKLDMHAVLNEKYKNIVGKLELAEGEILAKQSMLKSEQLKSQNLENQLKKLHIENAQLKEHIENHIKRMEKQALKLGETQAKSSKLKKEAEAAQNSFETLKLSSEVLQRENNKLNLECKSLKEKLFTCEKSLDQLKSKLETVEKHNEVLREEKQNIETSENDLKSFNDTLEKNKANLEEKVRKLTKSLNESNLAINRQEQDKVALNLEIGGLNKLLEESKALFNMKLKENNDLTTNLINLKNENQKLIELNSKCQIDANNIREENISLNDKLSKLSLRLKIAQEEHETAKTELDSLRADIEAQKNEKDTIEKDHLAAVARLQEIEVLVDEQQTSKNMFLEKIRSLDDQVQKLLMELDNSQEMLKEEKRINDKLNTDISILQAKLHKSRLTREENEKRWNEEKECLLMEVRASDDRIKETRLELEGKLEKMKNKMKTLYNDEITKMKKKQEREVAVLKSEHDTFKAQNVKLEEHTKKLSSQIFRLNENILEHQKQNTFLKTKIKDLETKPHQPSRTVTAAPSQSSSARQCLGSNLHMEDEEGEIFNNTYLSDLKSGRVSELFGRDICAQELQYRNSLLPPHLKSTYLAQFDHQMGEDEIRETPSLDDSLSTLLNTGQRKKVSGATSYKRPGPPTPSKNAGRLSFGGNGELSREILKETDTGNYQSAKTPAKFKLFSSRLSMKDENTPPNKRRLSNLFKKK